MPKQEVGSTKWLGNKMKAKGLQKLRWYCQMCQKQCRDENGFKCHRMSDGHQRQMQLFVQDPNKFLDDFSQEFELGFMQLMGHSYRSMRVLANTVYTDYISNRHHTHMNSTIWVTLSNFVQYLGRTNQCKIDKTPKGWFIQYVDNTPEAKMREAAQKEHEEKELAREVSHEQFLANQVKTAGDFIESEFTELQRKEGDAPIKFGVADAASSSSTAKAIAGAAAAAAAASRVSPRGGGGGNALEMAFGEHSKAKEGKASGNERKLSALERVRLEHEEAKRREEDAKRRKVKEESESSETSSSEEQGVPWVAAGLVVKVMHQDLAGGKYYRKKGVIEKAGLKGRKGEKGVTAYTADIRMVDTKDLIRLDQEMLETVIPNVDKRVMIVKGTRRGKFATMRAVDMANFSVCVETEEGTVWKGLGYGDVCKVA